MTDFKPNLTKQIINKKINKKPLAYFMTNHDFDKILKGATKKVVKYGTLDDKYTTFEQLMPKKKDYCILLIESEKNSGHWVCMLRNNNTFEYFDPYGHNHEKALDFTSEFMNKYLDNTDSDLNTLINNMKPNQKLITNNTQFQNDKFLNDVATCGRHIMCRIQAHMMANMSLEEYKNFIKINCKLYDLPSDVLICDLVPIN